MSHPQVPLRQLGKLSTGLSINRYKSSTGVSERVVKSGDLKDDHPQWHHAYISENLETITLQENKIQRYDAHRLQYDDIVISIRGGAGKAAWVNRPIVGSIAGQNVAFFRSKDQRLDPIYLLTLLSTSGLNYSLESLSKSSNSTIGSITIKQLEEIKIPLPSMGVQKNVVRMFLEKKKINNICTEIEKTYQDLAEAILVETINR